MISILIVLFFYDFCNNEAGHTGDKGYFAGEVKEGLSFEIMCACHVDC